MLDSTLIKSVASIAAALFALAFYWSICASAYQRRIQSNPVSWFIWSLNDSLIVAVSLALGARNTLSVPVVYAIFGWIIFGISIKNDRRNISRLEWTCLIGAVLSWIAFLLSIDRFLILLLGVFVNTLGAIPTIAQLFRKSDSQKFAAWMLIWAASVFSIISAEQLTASLVLFPVDSFLISSTILLLIR